MGNDDCVKNPTIRSILTEVPPAIEWLQLTYPAGPHHIGQCLYGDFKSALETAIEERTLKHIIIPAKLAPLALYILQLITP